MITEYRLNAYHVMWLFVFFDLPTTTKKERKYAAGFRKDLEKDGFRMMDLLFEAVRLRLEQPKMRNFRAMFEPEYRKLWLKYNRLGGLETSLVYLFGPRR